MKLIASAATAARIAGLVITGGFLLYSAGGLVSSVLMLIVFPSEYVLHRTIDLIAAGLFMPIVLLTFGMVIAPASIGEPAKFVGRSRGFWQDGWLLFQAALGGVAVGAVAMLLLAFAGIDLRFRWGLALCFIADGAILAASRQRRRALARWFGRITEPGCIRPRLIAAAVADILQRLRPAFGRSASWVVARPIMLDRPFSGCVATRREPWRDAAALLCLAGIKGSLLGAIGIYPWHLCDGAGYVELATQLQHAATWNSVPDLAQNVVPLSLLRMPGYPLLIAAVQSAAGENWIALLVALQLAVSLLAGFVLYRSIWMLSGGWLAGVLGAAWFAASHVGYFERAILTDSLTISLFTMLLCPIATAAFRRQPLSPIALAAIGLGFSLLFLLREANLVYAASLAPLLFLALPIRRRPAKIALLYAPLVAMFALIGAWQYYRTGYFLITTGSQGNPIEALALVDKVTPILDRPGPVDEAIRDATAGRSYTEVERRSWPIVLHANERLAGELHLNSPELARLLAARYVTAWLDHPGAMLAFMERNQAIVRTSGVSPFVFGDERLPERLRDFYSYLSQQIVEWGLITLPMVWLGILVSMPRLRRTALSVVALALAAIGPVAFYSAMFLESRYVLPALGPMLLVLGGSLGVAQRGLTLKQNQFRDALARNEAAVLS